MNTPPDLVIISHEIFYKANVEKSMQELEAEKLNIAISITPENQMYAAAEWAIPTIFCAYILQSYFEGFLSEAGREHYQILKTWLKSKLPILKTVKVIAISSDNSPDKISQSTQQSKTFSIACITAANVQLKFLFDDNLDIVDWELMLDKALELIEKHFIDFPNDEISIALMELKLYGNQLFAIIETETMTWKFTSYQL